MTIEKISFDKYKKIQAINASSISDFLICPYYYKYNLDHPSEDTEATQIGSLAHAMFFEPETVAQHYAAAPHVDRRTKEGRAIFNKFVEESQGKTVVKAQAFKDAEMIVSELQKCQVLLNLKKIGACFAEYAVFGQDMESGLNLKIKPDLLVVTDDFVYCLDLKTMAKIPTDYNIQRQISAYDYHIQAAFYHDVLTYEFSKYENKKTVIYLWTFISQSPPHLLKNKIPSEAILQKGRESYKKALIDMKKCIETDQWPTFNSAIEEIDVHFYGE